MDLKHAKKCSFKIALVLLIHVAVIPSSLCCHYASLYNFYGSATVDVGSDATFLCYGDGSYIYWFVDGVNTENMTAEEIEERGLSFSGYYNHYPPYYSGCDTQYSYMTIGGYCLNNNSEIYCVILGTAVYGSKSSSPVYFTVKGNPTVINDLTIIHSTENSLFITWDVSASTDNYTLTLDITGSHNLIDTIELTCLNQAYEYELNNPDLCIEYEICISIETDVFCNDIWNAKANFVSGTPAKAEIVAAMLGHNSVLLIQFEINNLLCVGHLPSKFEILLIDHNGGETQSSGLMLWENITVINGIYQIKWPILLKNNTFYQIFVITHNILGQALSEPFILSTYDTQKLTYTLDGSELCLNCTFAQGSTVKGCIASLLLVTTLQPEIPMLTRAILIDNTAVDCLTLSENGNYLISVYDWEKDGEISSKPAVVKWIIVNGVPSTLNTNTPLSTSENKLTSEESTLIIFITLFGITALTLTIFFVAGFIILVRKKLRPKKKSRTPVLNTYDYKIDNSDCVSLTEKLPPSQPNQENAHTYEMVDIPRPYVNINFR